MKSFFLALILVVSIQIHEVAGKSPEVNMGTTILAVR